MTGLLWPGSSPGSRLDIAERGPDARGGHLAPDLHLHLRLGRLGRLCPRGQRSPALKQPLWACKGHCSQGLGLSRATPTTSSGLTATGLPQSWARGPAPGCSSPATTLQAASTGASSGPACAQWSCHPRRCSCLLTTSPSPSTVTSLGRSRSAWWIHSTCPGDMLDPPSDLLSNITSNHCVLTWSINPALEPLASLLSYELAFKRQEETWERARHKDHIVGVTWLKLEATELDPGSTYEARLRVQMATPEDAVAEEERYEGPWSDWSQPTRFHSPQRQEVLERISDPGDLMDGKGKAQGCVIHPEYSRRRDINLPFWPEAPIQVLLPGEFGGTQPWALPAIGLLVPALGQRDSTLVSVSIFLLLTSLTYLLFKLSPRSVAKECVWECVHVSECVIVHVGVRIRMCMSVCVRLWVWGRRCIEGPNPHPLPQRSWVGRGFQASDPDQWGCPQLPGACGWWAVWPKRALEGPKVPGAESPEALVSCLWRCLALAHLHSGFMQTVLGIWFSRGPVSRPDGCHGQPDEQKSPPETSHHTWGLVPQETGQAWTGSREDERRLDRGSQGEGGTGCWARWVAKRTREGSGLPSGPRRAPEAWSRGMGSGLCFENGVLWYK
nr:uncharacterized protein LOC115861506 isoform X2 [Globicephala melas]